ncbi:unnamed protein product, partial [Sphagnum compactum]
YHCHFRKSFVRKSSEREVIYQKFAIWRQKSKMAETALRFKQYPFNSFADKDLSRKLKKLTQLDYAVLPEDKYKKLMDAVTSMEENYAKIRLCSFNDTKKCDLQLEPEITEIIAKSRNPEELKYYWIEWYNRAGTPMKGNFQKYVDLMQEAATLNGFHSGAEMWLDEYEVSDFEKQVEDVVEQLRPLYEQIHGYVRAKLRQYYGNEIVSEHGPIPMHLLGNMWGQSWEDVMEIVTPYPAKPKLDITDEMKKQGYTALKMFQMGDEFFQSLNMTKLPQTFWDKSIIEKPTDGRDLVCHASAWDFFIKDDVRIKQCTRVNMDFFFTTHHELGHIQYYLQYQHLPYVYRDGANPGFHEAVGDVLSLSVSTPKHLQKIGLLKEYNPDSEILINQYVLAVSIYFTIIYIKIFNVILCQGLTKFVFIQFAFTIDKYRWSIFRGEIKPEEYNCRFWELRWKYSGIEPPVKRTEADFDAPAKYHVSADVEYLRYFVSYIVQYQFYKSLCEKAGQFVAGDPEKTLNNCDIYQSTEAGASFKAMLSLGGSKPWPDAMEVLTGQRKMDAGPLLEYFKPLQDFLTKYNKDNNNPIGWVPSNKIEARDVVNSLNNELTKLLSQVEIANWNYRSNITSHNKKIWQDLSVEKSNKLKETALRLKEYPINSFTDKDLIRLLKKFTKLNYSVLPEDKLKQILDAISSMQEIYSKTKVCSYKEKEKCDLQLEPELTEIISTSRDEKELKYYWIEWYNKAGAPLREDFQKYVDLMQEAAVLNGFKSGAEVWLDDYEVPDFEEQVDAIVEQLKPLYEQIHGYVRAKLRQHYGDEVVSEHGPIPMHLLGNMWAQRWDDIMEIVAPYPAKPQLDVTDEMQKQGYTPLKMFQKGDEFFQSMNMTKLPQVFWDKSLLEKPTDGRDVVCHASAWDFYIDNDVRISQCTRPTMAQFFTAHHELGHIQYYLQYKDQPLPYREGANPGFHEAVGDVLSLSVGTPKHLQKIGLLKDYKPDEEALINQYLKTGMERFVYPLFAYTIDKYRWGIFRGEIKPEEYNCRFWELRWKYSGIEPPVKRTEADFDAPAKYHVSHDVEYLRYFVAYINEYQFYKALCEKAGQFVPGDPEKTLNNCDIYQSEEAGAAL